MSRILQLNTYPTVQPRHGGQRRAHQIARILEGAGHQVSRVAAYTFSGYGFPPSEPAIDLDQFPAPDTPTTWLYDGVRAMASDPATLGAFAAFCERAEPDLLQLEEVWLWPVVRQFDMVQLERIPIIYSSYNVEGPLFCRLLTGLGHGSADALGQEVTELEADVARKAFACAAVTENDAALLRNFGARRVVVAPNGVERRRRGHLAGALPEGLNPDHSYVLYVASAHRPNASGIPELFLSMLEVLRPLERLVVAGGVCHILAEWLRDGGPTHLARERMVLVGDVTDLCLDGLIANAVGIVLPLYDGGGSNLKTAEALDSCLPLVATSVAMRGYEAFRDTDSVIVADDPSAFAAGLRQIFDGRLARRVPTSALDSLLWDVTLLPMAELVNEALSNGAAATARTKAQLEGPPH